MQLRALRDTRIKRLTIDSSDILDPAEKFTLLTGEALFINWYRPASANHWEFELAQRHGTFFNWYAFKSDVEIDGVPLHHGGDSTQRKAFLDMIAVPEGTSGPNGYRTIFSGKLFNNGFVDHPREVIHAGGYASDAAGRYQFLSTTWDFCKHSLGLADFSPQHQDQAALFLISNRGAMSDVDAGRVRSACDKVSWEWASLPPGRYGQPTISHSKAEQLFTQFGGTLS